MNLKKNMFWIVFGLFMVIGTGLMLFALWKTRTGFTEVKNKLQQAESEYETLSNGHPYPSDENVKVVQQNEEKVEAFFSDLEALLCEGQGTTETVPGAQFSERLEVMFAGLHGKARQSNVIVPEDFHFGFDVYTEGELPSEEYVPRLMMQLKTIEAVCQLLFTNQVTDIQAIEREVFEDFGSVMGESMRMPGRGRGRSAGRQPVMSESQSTEQRGTDLYQIEGLRITFSTRDEQLWDVLNALSSQRPFAVVRSLELSSSGSGGTDSGIRRRRGGADPFRSPMGGFDDFEDFGEERLRGRDIGDLRDLRGAAGRRRSPRDGIASTLVLPREERIVAGRDERVYVDMLLDVYRFCVDDDAVEPAGHEEGS